RIDLRLQWGDEAPDSELQVVRAVAAGSADLGWTGSRVFDLIGATSFSALSAPMLVDSYPLEQALLKTDLPARILAGLKPLHLVGIGLLGDTLRRPISVRRALISPAAWRGIAFGSYPSRTQELAIRALGARPFRAFGAYREHALETGQI